MLDMLVKPNGKEPMAVDPRAALPAKVLVVEREASIRNAIARLLSLEKSLTVVGAAESESHAVGIEADMVIDESLLRELRNLSVADFIAMVRDLSVAPLRHGRHLRAVTGAHDMRKILSDRELEVVKLVAEGLSNKQISLRLELSDKTVKNHISHILAKMNLSARTQVAVHALRAGLV
jgi:DNA-binding NarL/FixJ family response regulator